MRARSGVARRRKKRRIFKRVKGFWGGRSRLLRTAKEALVRAEVYATQHRRKRKGDWRRVWIVRINAACRARGINYSQFMRGVKAANIELNRKVLADIAVRDSALFDEIVAKARESLPKSA